MSGAVDTGHVGFTVTDLERSLAFYRDGLGLELVARSSTAHEQTRRVLGDPTMEVEMAVLRLPNSTAYLQLLQFGNPVRAPVDPDHFNPGAGHLAVYVDDLDAVWAALEGAGSRLVSDGTVTLVTGPMSGGRVVCCTDPDGFRVELIESPRYLDGSVRNH